MKVATLVLVLVLLLELAVGIIKLRQPFNCFNRLVVVVVVVDVVLGLPRRFFFFLLQLDGKHGIKEPAGMIPALPSGRG